MLYSNELYHSTTMANECFNEKYFLINKGSELCNLENARDYFNRIGLHTHPGHLGWINFYKH